MKRWLVASVALNLVMVGVVVGYMGASSMPFRPPMPPPPGAERGFQRVLVDSVMALPAERRDGAMEIIHQVRDKYMALPRPPRVHPKDADDMMALFDAGKLPPEMPVLESLIVNRKLDFQETHEIAYLLQSYLQPEERHMVANAMRENLHQMRKRLRRAGLMPPDGERRRFRD